MKSVFKKLVIAILTWEARLVIRRHKPSVVAITGSVGKTSTKDAVYAVLAGQAQVRKSDKNFNSEIGIPLSILGRPNAWNNPLRWLQNIFDGLLIAGLGRSYPDWLVLEIGADRPGDIRKVVTWLPVDIAVITRLPEVPVHVEYFDSPEMVREEKAALIAGLRPSGVLILSVGDERVVALRERCPAGITVLTYGFSGSANVAAEVPEIVFGEAGRAAGMRSRITVGGESRVVTLYGALGAHVFESILAALAVAHSLDMKLEDSAAALEHNYVPPPGRMYLMPGMHRSLIVDDTYNSSPAAVEGALKTLAAIPAKGHKYAVLGDMMELGRFSVPEHRKVGVLAARCLATRKREPHMLITVGIRSRDVAAAARETGLPEKAILQCEDAEEAGAELARRIKPGDVVLIKGSQSMRMERTVKLIMAEPNRASLLLVRQEGEWTKQ